MNIIQIEYIGAVMLQTIKTGTNAFMDFLEASVGKWLDSLEVDKTQVLTTTRITKNIPDKVYVISADKRKKGYVITGEEQYLNQKQNGTSALCGSFRFEKGYFNLSETLDILYTVDKIYGLTEEQSRSYRLMQDPDINYLPSKYASLESIDDIEKTFCTTTKQYIQAMKAVGA